MLATTLASLLLALASGAWAAPPKKELADPAKPGDKEQLEKKKTLPDDELKEAIKKKKYYKDKELAKEGLLEKQKPGKLPPGQPPPQETLEPAPEAAATGDAGPAYSPRRRGDDETDAPPPPPEEVERVSRQVSSQGSRAVGRAMRGAEEFRRSLLPGQELAPESAGKGPGLDAARGLKPRGATDPADPSTPHDLVLASISGFGASFTSLGLKAGSGPAGEPAILRSDGTLASPEQVLALRARIGAEPKALMRQPDFFEVLPRERFEDLKQDFHERPELRESAFRHVTLTERDRDFQWSASCSLLSGDCNPHASARSYRKGDDVPAKDLGEIWEDVAGTEPEDEEDGVSEYTDEDLERRALAEAAQERLSTSIFGGARVARLLESAASAFSGLTGLFGGEAAGEARAAGTDAPVAAAPGTSSRSAQPTPAAPGAVRPPEPLTPPSPRRAAGGRAPLLLGAAAAALALLFALARRRR